MAICPYCAEEIQELAIKCKHCKEWLPELDNDNTLSEREGELCPDGTCTGHIYDGSCSNCGLTAEETFKIKKTRRRISTGNLEGELCLDGTCTGHIYGGICTTCGLTAEEAQRVEKNNRNRPLPKGELAILCPYCKTRGTVRIKPVHHKKGISGAKATGALLTAGISLLFVGLSKKETLTRATCSQCNSSWDY